MKPEDIKLLIVEDDEELRKTISDVFALYKFNVRSVGDGQAAWELIQGEEFTIIISDMRLPRLSGHALLKKVKTLDPNFPRFIGISGFNDVSLAELYRNGIDGFFAKPFDISEVRKCIQRCLVDIRERWAQPQSDEGAYPLIKKFPSFAKAVAGGEILFGRLGFFLPRAAHRPNPGEIVKLELTFGNPKVELEFTGLGKVVFKSRDGAVAGIGVEILQLNPEAIAVVSEYLKKNRPMATIPIS